MCLEFFEKNKSKGLIIIRIGMGAMFMFHGYGKIMGGTVVWAKVGGAMQLVGIPCIPAFWGFMAALSEFGGGLCLILGLFFRPACVLMLITMLVAANMHLVSGDGLQKASHAIEAGIVFLGLLFTGSGNPNLDEKIKNLCRCGKNK